MAIIAVFNLASAVGKTTTAIELARALGSFGARVLLLDLTPDQDATFAVDRVRSVDLAEVLERDLPLETCIGASALMGVDLLALPPVPLASLFPRKRSILDSLMDLIRRASAGYAYVVIDLPDGTGDVTRAALRVADAALVPLPAEEESIDDASRIVQSLEDLRRRESLRLSIVLLLTMVSGTAGARVAAAIREAYPRLVLPTAIPLDESLQGLLYRRPSGSLPSPAENAYQAAAMELARRLSAVMAQAG